MKIKWMRDRFDWNVRFSLSRFSLVCFSGGLTIFAFPHEDAYSFLAWICMVPWIISLQHAEWKERLFYGSLYGILYIVPNEWREIWFAIQLKDWSYFLGFFLTTLFFCCYVIPFVIHSMLRPRLIRNHRLCALRQAIFLTCAISWFPTYFPGTPACFIHDQPLLYQTADFGGVSVVLLTVLFVNFSISEMLVHIKNKKILIWNFLTLCVFVCIVVLYGAFRFLQFENQKSSHQGKEIEITALQTRTSPTEDLRSLVRQNSRFRFSALEWAAYAVQQHPNIELIVFPESPIDTTRENWNQKFLQAVAAFAKQYNKNIFFQWIEPIPERVPPRYFITSHLVHNDGMLGEKYRKKILTPFYEYNPIQKWVHLGNFEYVSYNKTPLIELEDHTLIPAICYEIHWADHIRQGALAGGEIIIHIGNFHSFGNGGTIAYIDLALTKLRAVENRVPIVRSCNWGYGAFIQASGTVLHKSLNRPIQRNALTFSVFVPEQRGMYTSIGDLFLYILTILTLADLFTISRDMLVSCHIYRKYKSKC